MSYRLDPATRVGDGLRGVSFAELDLAHTALGSPPERHSGVHSARKCLKRLRSLLLLVRPGMPEPAFVTLTDRLAVINEGVLSPPLVTHEATIEQIGLLMGGLHGLDREPLHARGAAHVA